jgi:C1A family cysteine protease
MATKQGIELKSIDGFPSEVITQLAALWITTAEELVSAAALENGIAGLASATGQTEDDVNKLVELATAALPPESTISRGITQPHGLGALDEYTPGEELESLDRDITSPLPPSVDLHDRMPKVRDQGQRGTCVSFACTAVREYLTGPSSAQSDFSEQFLYWNCKKHDNYPGSGTWIHIGMGRLQADGVPAEAVWPYNRFPVAGNEGQDPPPPDAMSAAAANKILSHQQLNPKNVDALRQALVDGNPISFGVPVYTHWFAEPTHSTGDVRLPLPGEKLEGGHAMCMVGYQTDETVPGGGYFLVRNSWGTNWGRQNPVSAGHARIPFAYLSTYGNSAYIAKVQTVEPVEPDEPVVKKSWWQRFLDWLRKLFP